MEAWYRLISDFIILRRLVQLMQFRGKNSSLDPANHPINKELVLLAITKPRKALQSTLNLGLPSGKRSVQASRAILC